jgi:hypothetical protein
MDVNQVNSMLQEFLKQTPSKTTLDVYEFVRQHRGAAIQSVNGFVKNFEDFFEEMNMLVQLLNYPEKSDWTQRKGIQYILYPETMKTLHRAYEDAIDGYYDESLMLVRSVYEVFIKIVFLSCYPNEWEAVFYDRKGKRNFSLTGFVQDHLKLDWSWLYKLMSKIYHGKVHRHLPTITQGAQGKHKAVILQYAFNQDSLNMCVNLVSLMQNCLFHAAMNIFGNDLATTKKIENHQITRFQNADTILLGITEVNPKEGFSTLANDLRKIGKLLAAVENNHDWKGFV